MDDDDHERQHYMVEFTVMGKSVKVTAIDPVSMKEVSIVGPRKATQKQLTDVAVRKLKYVLAKEKGE